jgi:hypothetical protein
MVIAEQIRRCFALERFPAQAGCEHVSATHHVVDEVAYLPLAAGCLRIELICSRTVDEWRQERNCCRSLCLRVHDASGSIGLAHGE